MSAADSARRFLSLDGTLPQKVRVDDITPEGHATRVYSVVLDYDWAESILAWHVYQRDALGIAYAVSEVTGAEVTDAAVSSDKEQG